MFWAIFDKKSLFFRSKKKFEGNFFLEITKKRKMTLPDESKDVIVKSQEIWNCFVHSPENGS